MQALELKTELLLKTGDLENTAAAMSALANHDPKNSKVHLRLGLLFLRLEKYKEADEALSKAISLEPG